MIFSKLNNYLKYNSNNTFSQLSIKQIDNIISHDINSIISISNHFEKSKILSDTSLRKTIFFKDNITII